MTPQKKNQQRLLGFETIGSAFQSRSGHLAFDVFTRAFNGLADDVHRKLDRRLFERMFLVYALVEYQLFMGEEGEFMNECVAFFPRNIFTDLDNFILANYDKFYKQFVLFWASHSAFHQCRSQSEHGGNCSTTIICDGHMKIRRRLCANPNVQHKIAPYFSPIFEDFVVGCRHSPANNSRLCNGCMDLNVGPPIRKKALTKREKEAIRQKRKRAAKTQVNDMASVSSCWSQLIASRGG